MDVFIKRAQGERDREGLLKAIITRRLVEINLGVDEDETRDGGDDKCLSIKATVGLCWTGSSGMDTLVCHPIFSFFFLRVIFCVYSVFSDCFTCYLLA